MIQAKDLRIGNLISAALYPNAITVESICSSNEDIYNRDTGEIPLHSIFPITLSSDWLLKFGFKFSNGFYEMKINFLYIAIMLDNTTLMIEDVHEDAINIKSPEFVHQLQNVFYCLTGEELQVVANGS